MVINFLALYNALVRNQLSILQLSFLLQLLLLFLFSFSFLRLLLLLFFFVIAIVIYFIVLCCSCCSCYYTYRCCCCSCYYIMCFCCCLLLLLLTFQDRREIYFFSHMNLNMCNFSVKEYFREDMGSFIACQSITLESRFASNYARGIR